MAAYKMVKANKGADGVDGISIEEFEEELLPAISQRRPYSQHKPASCEADCMWESISISRVWSQNNCKCSQRVCILRKAGMGRVQ